MSTYFPSGKNLAGKRKWYLIDATGQTVGHLASEVASILSGKRSPEWTPFLDMGDHVVVINARKVVLKGNKVEQKLYRHHTRYPGGLREITAKQMLAKRPDRVIELAIRGMLPKNKLGKAMAKKLKIYADADHPHSAQRPQVHQLTHQTNPQ
jgi:large subunit ribosomal protein L13